MNTSVEYLVNKQRSQQLINEADNERLAQNAANDNTPLNTVKVTLARQLVRFGERLQAQPEPTYYNGGTRRAETR